MSILGVLDLLPNVRSAWRTCLLATDMPAVTLAASLAASGRAVSTTMSGLDFAALGFRVGDYVTFDGFTKAGNIGLKRLTKVEAKRLTVDADLENETRSAVVVAVEMPALAEEAVLYRPELGTPYMAEVVRAVDNTPNGVGVGIVGHLILASATLFYPAGHGTIGIESMLGRFQQQFYPGRNLSYGGQGITVFKSAGAPLNPEPEWVSMPLTVTLRTWTLN